MTYTKKFKTFCLIVLTFLMIPNAQAYWLENVTQAIKENKIATFMSISTLILGYIGYKLWQKNKNLKQEIDLKNKKISSLDENITVLNANLDQSSSLIKQVLEEEKLREEQFSEMVPAQEAVEGLKTQTQDKKRRKRTNSIISAYEKLLEVYN